MTIEEARIRVARGAALLDRVRPGWARQIDVGTLTLHDPCGCIVGQLCPSIHFSSGVDNLAPRPTNRARRAASSYYGFDIPQRDAERDRHADVRALFQPLQDAWIEQIAARVVPGERQDSTAVAGTPEEARPLVRASGLGIC
jgi:hypothetical protein